MGKKSVFIFMLVVFVFSLISLSTASIVINEVYVNPIETETGGEAIELYNNGDDVVDISGLIVKTKSSATDAVLPDGSAIVAGGYFLISDVGFNEVKDNVSWVDSDYEEAMTFTNTDGGVSIILQGEVLDSIAWGDVGVVPVEFIEGDILSIPGSGFSFYRVENGVDTDNNLNDFISGEPNFRNLNYRDKLDNSINVLLNVIDMHSYIDDFGFLDDDLLTEGIQIVPMPGEIKMVSLFADVRHENFTISSFSSYIGGDEYDFVFNNSINDSHNRYISNIVMNYYDSPKEYLIDISLVNNNSVSSNYNTSFEYMSLRAIQVDATAFSCDIVQGSNCEFLGDSNFTTTGFTTVKNLGNVDTNIIVKPESIFNGVTEYPYSEIIFDIGGISQTLNSDGVVSDQVIPYGKDSYAPLKFSFTAPENLKAGNYEGSIKIIATE